MPTVPIEQNRVGIASVSGEKLQAADFSSVTDAIGGGLRSLGGAINQAAEAESVVQKIYNDAAVRTLDNEGENGRSQILRTGPNAYFNLQGAAALEAKKPTLDALAKLRSDLLGKAKNDYQRRVFGQVFDQRTAADMDAIEAHAAKETVQWGVQEATAGQQLSADSAVDAADDAALFDKHLHTGLDAIVTQGRLTGASPKAVELAQVGYVSSIRSRIVDRKMISDPVGAAAYYQSHLAEFTAADRVKIEKALYDPLMERQASADVDGLMGSDSGAFATAPAAPSGGGSTLGRMVAITMHSESRSRDFNADGSLVRSSKGAEGRMQTLPSTQADPGFGVRPAQDDSVEEKARVGRDYLAALVKRYGGDPAKAWAAYNAGPGRVDQAIKDRGAGWLAALPKETRDYVSTNVAALGGNAPVYAPRRDDLAALYQRIDEQPWDFERKKQARAELDRRVARDDHLQRRAEDDAKDQAFGIIDQLGDGFTSINQLPADVRRRLSPEVRHSLMEQAQRNAEPKPVAANGDVALGYNLMAIAEPEKFKSTDLRLIRDKVTPGEFAELAKLQARQRTNGAAPEVVSHNRIWGMIGRYAPDLGLDLGTRAGKPNNAQSRQDAMRIFSLMQTDLMAHTGGTRQPTDDEIKQAFDRATVTVKVQTPGWLWGTNEAEKKRFQVSGDTGYQVDVPATTRGRIVQLFRAQGVARPSDADVQKVYLQHKGEPGFWD